MSILIDYKLEDNIDFYAELYKSLNDDDVENLETDQLCLITDQPLTENFVKLPCHHSFNYMPLFKDLVNYKKKYLLMEATGLKINQIRCPYCRVKHNMLLPFYENVAKEHGVNYIDEKKINGTLKTPHSCCHILSYMSYNMEPVLCNNSGKLLEKNGKYYCNYHTNKMIKTLLKKEEVEAKAEQKKKNMELKENEKKMKLELKEKEKKEKKMALSGENVILTNSGVGCIQILKTGERKGQCCAASSIYLDSMCMRHYKMSHKKI